VSVRIREDDKATYMLKSMPEAAKYLLDIDEFDGTPYYIVGSNLDDAVFVYSDPLPTLKGQQNTSLLVPAVMRLLNPQFVSFSPDSHLIVAQSGNKLIVYDIEGDRQFKLDLKHIISLETRLNWMDGFRFAFADSGQSYMVDYDGSNEQLLAPSTANGPFFDTNSENLMTLAPSKTVTGRFSLTQTSLEKKQ